MCAYHFCVMKPSINPDNGLSLGSQGFCFCFGKVLCPCHALCNGLVFFNILVVFGRGDDHHELIPSFLRFPNACQFCPVRCLIQFFKISFSLCIVGQLIVVPNAEAKMFFWGWDGLGHSNGADHYQQRKKEILDQRHGCCLCD